MMTMIGRDVIRIDDQTSKAELAEAITNLAKFAARQQHHPDCGTWVRAHERIDALLTEWETAPA